MLEQPGEVDLTVQDIPVPPPPQVVKSSDEILCELFGAFNATPPPLVEITADSIKSVATIKKKVHKKHKKHTKKKQKKVKKKKRSSSSESKKSKDSNKKVCKRQKKDSIKTSTTDSESVDSKKKKRKLGKFSASDSDSDDEPKQKKKKSEHHKKSNSGSKHGSHSDSEDPKNKKKKSEQHKKLSSGTKHGSDSDSEDPKNKKKKSEQHKKLSCGTKHGSNSDIDDEPKKKKKKSEHCKKSSSGSKHKVKIKQEKEESSESKVKDLETAISTVPNSIKDDIFKHAVSKIVEKVIDSTNLASEICKSIVGVKVESDSEGQQDMLPRPIKQEPQNVEKEAQPKVHDSKPPKSGNENPAVGTKPVPVAEVFAEDLLESGVKTNELKPLPDKPKIVGGKIKIQNLKFSQVYEATVKQIEEEAKLKAEKYEEGELSDSSSEQERSPTPSEHSTTGSIEELKQEKEKKRHRHHHKKEKHRHRERNRDRRRSTSKERNHSSREGSHPHKNRKSSHRDKSLSKRESSHHHHRERSKERTRDRSWSREKSRDERSQDSGENVRFRHRNRSHSKDKIERNSEDKIDKQKLLEIARKNALSMMKNPSGAQEQTKVAITSGGKTVNELTDFCKQLSKKDADGHESISSNTSHSSDSESEKPFHHPFLIKDRPSSIVLNIRNSVALPVKSLQEKTAEQSRQLRLQFPVSSGQHHRKTESDWVPVSPKKPEAPSTQVAVVKPTTNKQPAKVFKDTPTPPSMDIGLIVSQRLMAMRRLQENPADMEALTQMYAAQQNMQSWAESKQLPPGQFSGSTGVKVLSQAELAAGYQAWARRAARMQLCVF